MSDAGLCIFTVRLGVTCEVSCYTIALLLHPQTTCIVLRSLKSILTEVFDGSSVYVNGRARHIHYSNGMNENVACTKSVTITKLCVKTYGTK